MKRWARRQVRRQWWRRVGAGAWAAVAALWWGLWWGAPPAAAATAVSEPEEGATLSGVPTIVGAFELSRPITHFTVLVTATGPQGAAASVSGTCDSAPAGFSCSDDRRSVSFSWRPPLGRNGPYRITGTAVHERSGLLDRDESADLPPRSFTLVVPPAPPTGLTATLDPDTREVTLRWRANTEDDLIGYVVYRAQGDDSFRQVAALTDTPRPTVSWRDTDIPAAGGQYRWFVVAVRNGASGDDSTIAVSRASTPAAVAVPEAPGAPTTTTSSPAGTPAPAPATTVPVVDVAAFRSTSRAPRLDLPPPPPPPDPGFQSTLPYPTTTAVPTTSASGAHVAMPVSPAGDTEPVPRRPALVLLAAALLAVMLSMHLRWLLARTADPDVQPSRAPRLRRP